MSDDELRAKLRGEVQAVDATVLLPHHRRGALIIVAADLDLIDAAVFVCNDDTARVAQLIQAGSLVKPSLGDLADWCVDTELQFQYLIAQPYVLAQPLPRTPAGQLN